MLDQSTGSQFQLSGDPLPQQGHPTEEKTGGGSAKDTEARNRLPGQGTDRMPETPWGGGPPD